MKPALASTVPLALAACFALTGCTIYTYDSPPPSSGGKRPAKTKPAAAKPGIVKSPTASGGTVTPSSDTPTVKGKTIFGGGAVQPFLGEAFVIPDGTAKLPNFNELVPFAKLYTDQWSKVETNKKVGMLLPADADGNAIRGLLIPALQKAGFTVVDAGPYQNGLTDFSAQIAKVAALPEQPDFYYIAAMPHNIGTAVKQFRDAGLTGPIVGGDGYDTPDLLTVAGAAANDVYFTTHALMDPAGGTDGIKAFIEAYTARFGHAPENAFAALGYDSIKLLADAITRAGGLDGAALKSAIETTTEFPGITGAITFTPESHVPQKGVTVIAVKDGAFTLGSETVPTYVPAP